MVKRVRARDDGDEAGPTAKQISRRTRAADANSLPLDSADDDLTALEAAQYRVDEDSVGRFDRRGARSKYNAELFPKTVRFLVARGATQEEVADCLGVSRRTLQYWLNEHPELADAFQAGRDVFLPRVARALAERALGFYVDEVVYKKDGQGVLQACKVRKYIPPDVTAQIFFLKNTDPAHWRDVQKVEHSGAVYTSSAELAQDLQKQLAALQADGYIEGVVVKELPPPEE